jgi:hypothetical protein
MDAHLGEFFFWCVEGSSRYYSEGIDDEPAAVVNSTAKFFSDQDVVVQFLEQAPLEHTGDAEDGVSLQELAEMWAHSDINMIALYMNTPGQEKLGYILLSMFVACIAIQLMIVIGQNWKKKKRLPGEMLVVVVGLKPVWDCYNVVRGKAQEEHNVADAKTELVASKCGELL